MDQEFRQKLGTNLLICAPRSPLPKKRLKKLSQMLSDLEEVREAHLPEVIEVGSPSGPAQVLFVVIDPEHAIATVMHEIEARIKRILRSNEHVDVRPITPEHSLLPTIRDTNCVVGWRD